MCLALGHKAVMPVRLEPDTPKSLVKHSTTELPIISKTLLSKGLVDAFCFSQQFFSHDEMFS